MSTLEKTISLLNSMPEQKIQTVYRYALSVNTEPDGGSIPLHSVDCDCPLCRKYRHPNKETLEAFDEIDSGGGRSFSGSTSDFMKMILEEDD